eukprot:TRINITY_DN7001_c0_g2_i3.p1 TRINITY_DN7001_c0_g2~~TRINITY_DN7001_c0_g2_i3.p1  ORF type:complete len:240 (+),score=45.76 TRINITY_DN7001_c0_g2_i3:65-784(+)
MCIRDRSIIFWTLTITLFIYDDYVKQLPLPKNMWVLSIFGWGIPAAITLITHFANPHLFGYDPLLEECWMAGFTVKDDVFIEDLKNFTASLGIFYLPLFVAHICNFFIYGAAIAEIRQALLGRRGEQGVRRVRGYPLALFFCFLFDATLRFAAFFGARPSAIWVIVLEHIAKAALNAVGLWNAACFGEEISRFLRKDRLCGVCVSIFCYPCTKGDNLEDGGENGSDMSEIVIHRTSTVY